MIENLDNRMLDYIGCTVFSFLCKIMVCIISVQTIDYKAGKRKRREYRKLNAVDKGETASDEVTLWQELIHIPPVPPTGLSRCNLIDINYELHVCCSKLHGGYL